MSPILSPQAALVYVMVVAAVADSKLMDSELTNIKEIVKVLPIFKGYEREKFSRAAADCTSLLDQEDGLEVVISLVKEALPKELYETAYAVACDIVSVDGIAEQEELRWLEMLRHRLGISRLHAAAIERGSRARYMRMESLTANR
jgi:tellurite resistance protein